jgi:fused signal recognition particle receptor
MLIANVAAAGPLESSAFVLTTISLRMLKWFRRDKNDPQTGPGPDPALAATPTEAAGTPGAEGLAATVHDEAALATSATVVPAVGASEVVATDATAQVDPPPAVAPVQSPSQPVTASSVEAPIPWWRYEGVWRAPKPPVPREPTPAPAAAQAPVHEQQPDAVAEAPVAPEPVAAHADLAPVGRDPEPAPVVAGPSGLDREPVAESDDTVPVLFAPEAALPEPAKPRSLRERLAATARALTASVGSLFKRNPKLDDDLLEELETALIQADVGVTASTELVAKLGVRMRKREFADAQALLAALRTDLRALIVNHARPLHIPASPQPFVILTVGVNGAGKTTTIGKLAMRYKQAGHSVMLAAGDTFRAAAVEQLKTWGDRNQVAVIAQGSGADSASVIFDALQAAKSRGIDVLIADTAGRLHTQGHLMQELAKVKRVLGKIDPDAPHETLLVIDGGTGQNALVQAKQFHQAVGLTGIVVTKLDGTAKGGMVFALCRELGLPIRFIGVGEKREDLREFDAEDFVDALLPRELGG